MGFPPQASIVIETTDQVRFAVIWLHGLGASGDDFVPVVDELKKSAPFGVRFIFPNAPMIPVTVNGGYIMPAWYDILSMSGLSREVDHQGIMESIALVQQLIAEQIAQGIAADHIFLAGFSQGGAIAYSAALTAAQRLAGIIALSTYIPEPAWLKINYNVVQQSIPVLAMHGTQDPVVSLQLGQQAYQQTQQLGAGAVWFDYPMQHQVCWEQIQQIDQWLSAQLAAIAKTPA
jgi:phospholipase/carboxylesterase